MAARVTFGLIVIAALVLTWATRSDNSDDMGPG